MALPCINPPRAAPLMQARLREQLDGLQDSMQLQQEHAEQALADANTRSEVGWRPAPACLCRPSAVVCCASVPFYVVMCLATTTLIHSDSHGWLAVGIASGSNLHTLLSVALQGLEEELAAMQRELRSCCTQMAAAERQAAAAAAEAGQERQRRQEAEQQLLAAQQSVER